MHTQQPATKDLYFTNDHEWVDFKGPVAYTGICSFKLTGFREIQQISFNEPLGYKKKGEIIATVSYLDYVIEAHMPVDGKVVRVNNELVTGDKNVLLNHAETIGWIAMIAPSQPYERSALLLPVTYRMNNKSRYAK